MEAGRVLRKWRKAADISQQDLAVALGVTVTMVSRWENDRNVPTRAHAEEMDERLGSGGELVRAFGYVKPTRYGCDWGTVGPACAVNAKAPPATRDERGRGVQHPGGRCEGVPSIPQEGTTGQDGNEMFRIDRHISVGYVEGVTKIVTPQPWATFQTRGLERSRFRRRPADVSTGPPNAGSRTRHGVHRHGG